ncbi:beta-glucosidase-domain-containing protein [Astrocystis sublimbata]|nr:beta-glucosidase-domain-containing protein [Astrocystis sublimbata]
MKTTTLQATLGSAMLFVATQPSYAGAQHHHHQHRELHHQHHHHAAKRETFQFGNATFNYRYGSRRPERLQARGSSKCEFPKTKGLFAVTPGSMNGGWALAPDQECVDGTWCPIACPSGQVMAQWKPDSTYSYPESTYGGIYCNGGEIEVPFEDSPWCVDGTGTVEAVNKAGSVVSFCQTVLPGYEDMIIPTDVHTSATLAVPDPSYWDSTASHFYINAPGVSADEGCHWGDESTPIGNWAPYVAGANTDGSGNTFVKLGLNPVWQDSGLSSTKPTFGLKVECDGNCNGLPCEIDGSGVVSDLKATGAGGSDFCVVTVSKGGKASIVVYNLDGSGSDGGDGGNDDESTSSPEPTSTSTSTPTPTPTPTTTVEPTTSIPTTTSVPPTTSTPTPTPTSTSSSEVPTTSSSEVISTTSEIVSTTSEFTSSSSTSSTSTSSVETTSSSLAYFIGAVYHQNATSTADRSSHHATKVSAFSAGSTSESESESGSGNGSGSGSNSANGGSSETEPSPSESSQAESAGQRQDGVAVAGLVVAFVAAIYLL